MSCFDSGNFVF